MIMHRLIIETKQLILRKDMETLYHLLMDEDVNTFLPWFPIKNREETISFYQKRIKEEPYFLAICLKESQILIGYVKMSMDESHDINNLRSGDVM